MQMEILSESPEMTEKIAADFVEKISKILAPAGQGSGAVVVGLYGDLGSGKTAFVKGVAKAFGISSVVTSPTFVIEKIYKLENSRFGHLVHIDAYRLEKSGDLAGLGWKEISGDPKNLIFIEWPERVQDILPPNILKLKFAFVDETKRRIIIEFPNPNDQKN